MPEGDEVAEPREVFWAEAKQSPEQKEGRGTSQVDGKMEAQTKSGAGEGANQPYAKASPVCAADFDSDEVLPIQL